MKTRLLKNRKYGHILLFLAVIVSFPILGAEGSERILSNGIVKDGSIRQRSEGETTATPFSPRTTKKRYRARQPATELSDRDLKKSLKLVATSLRTLEETLNTRMWATNDMIAHLKQDVQTLNVNAFDQSRTFNLNEDNIECLTGKADRSNMNNSLSMYFTSWNGTLDREISQLYKTYDASRICLSQDEALHWLQKLMMKAGLSNTPVAIFHSQTGVEEPKEIVNANENLNPNCQNLEMLDRNSSVVYVYNNSCVRMYTDKDCQGESFLFTGNDGAGFPFVGNLKYFDKKGRSVGPCIPTRLN